MRELTVWQREVHTFEKEASSMARTQFTDSTNTADRATAIDAAIASLRPFDDDDEVASAIEVLVAIGEGGAGDDAAELEKMMRVGDRLKVALAKGANFELASALRAAEADLQIAYLASVGSGWGEASTRRQIEGIRKAELGDAA
jgi:hypothetical protein